MKKYKLIGITDFGYKYLTIEDIEHLKDMIGCEVSESWEVSDINGGTLLEMPDGENTCIDFLKLEEIK